MFSNIISSLPSSLWLMHVPQSFLPLVSSLFFLAWYPLSSATMVKLQAVAREALIESMIPATRFPSLCRGTSRNAATGSMLGDFLQICLVADALGIVNFRNGRLVDTSNGAWLKK